MPDAATLTHPRPGACVQGRDAVTFGFYAPGKKCVHLLGDFNGWAEDAEPLQEVQGLWSTTVCLPPGRHRYQFLVDRTLRICDPYAREVERGKTDKDPPRAIVETGAVPFGWQHDSWRRPDFAGLIYYEILLYDFSQQRNLRGLIEKLDYLKALGVNALELMPIYTSRADDVWGYEPNYFFAIRPEYGTPRDLKELVDEAHAREMAVVLDIIFAHTGHFHPFKQLYEYEKSPWYGQSFGAENEYGLPPFDHEKPATQAFCRDVLRYWLEEYHIDGYRLDYVNLIDEKHGLGVPKLIADIRACRRDAYVTSEMLPEDPAKTSRWDNDAAWHWYIGMMLRERLLEDTDYALEQKMEGWKGFLKALIARDCGYSRPRDMVNYTESHDESRLMNFFQEAGLSQEEMARRAALASLITFTMAGVPMLYHGQEWGECTEMKTLEANPLHWEALENPVFAGLHDFYTRLAWFRREEPALRSENMEILCQQPRKRCLAYHRWAGTRHVVVVANLSAQPQRIKVPFPREGVWERVFAAGSLAANGAKMVRLEPHGFHVFRLVTQNE